MVSLVVVEGGMVGTVPLGAVGRRVVVTLPLVVVGGWVVVSEPWDCVVRP